MAEFIKTSTPKVTSSPRVDQVGADRIELSWTLKTALAEDEYFEIYLKDITNKTRWKLVTDDNMKMRSFTVTGLKPDTQYAFKVRVVNESVEGEFSPDSQSIRTQIPVAITMRELSRKIPCKGIQKYEIPVKEVKEARNETQKTRRFEIGTPPLIHREEKTILLVGATGTGKSTLVDGLVNYIYGVNLNDDFRFTLIRLESSEIRQQENQAVSQTDWITCYTIYPQNGRIPFTLNIIDTPGFGDTRGFERDEELIGQIRHLFSNASPKGVTIIDAVCFLVKAPDARLTGAQRYIFQQIMSLFGKDIENNICTMITFADGEEPSVLQAMKASNLPFGKHFRFNNSALFAGNRSASRSFFTSMFWNLGLKSFEQFFELLETLTSKSLSITKSVLESRFILKTAQKNLMPLLDQGIGKVSELRQEIKIFEENQRIIKENKDFTYTVSMVKTVHKDLPPNKHTLICGNCNVTCHDNCDFEDNKDKAKCSAMGSDGKCTHCFGKCIWSRHTSLPYILTNEIKTEERSYEEMKKKYKEAAEKSPSIANVLKRIQNELDEHSKAVLEILNIINICNNRLEENALRPSTLSTSQYIDTLIKSKEIEKKDGYAERVQALKVIRRRCDIDSKDMQFTMNAKMTLIVVDKTTGMYIKETIVEKIQKIRKFFDFKDTY